MRKLTTLFILSIFILPDISHAQDLAEADSIYRLLLIAPGDSNLSHALNSSIEDLSYSNADTALYYAQKLDSLSVMGGYPHGSAMAMNQQGVCYELSGDMYKAIETYLAGGAAVVCAQYDQAPLPFAIKDQSCHYTHTQLARLVVFPKTPEGNYSP